MGRVTSIGVIDDDRKFLEELGVHLRQVREDLGVRQVDLARRIKMDATNLNKIEHGSKNLTVETLLRIAKGLDAKLSIKVVPRKK